MPAIASPSAVVVTNQSSLAENFGENATGALCQAASSAGQIALLGAVAGKGFGIPPQALVSLGAFGAIGAALCPSSFTEGGLLGQPPSFTGGQCIGVQYGIRQKFKNKVNLQEIEGNETALPGPIQSLTVRQGPGQFGPVWISDVVYGTFNGSFAIDSQLTVATWDFLGHRVYRKDNQPDNCGNAPRTGGQVIQNVNNGDTINNNQVTDNSNNIYVTPVVFNFAGNPITINMPFSNFRVNSLFPLDFNVEIGKADFRFKIGADGTPEPVPTNPNPGTDNPETAGQEKLLEALNEIKACVCSPSVELDALMVPFVDEAAACEIDTFELLIARGGISGEGIQRLQRSAEAALRDCQASEVEQLPEALIYSGTMSLGGAEQFTGDIPPDVVSLRVKITSFNAVAAQAITTFPEANQRKFGSVSFVTKSVDGGGDYIYLFDTDNYVPLPKRGKDGRLRLLLKPDTSFQVYDTGERLKDV